MDIWTLVLILYTPQELKTYEVTIALRMHNGIFFLFLYILRTCAKLGIQRRKTSHLKTQFISLSIKIHWTTTNFLWQTHLKLGFDVVGFSL